MNVAKLPPGMDQEYVQRLLCQQADIAIGERKEERDDSYSGGRYTRVTFFDTNGNKIPWYWDEYVGNNHIIETVINKLSPYKRDIYETLIGDTKDLNMQGFLLAGIIIDYYHKDDCIINFNI